MSAVTAAPLPPPTTFVDSLGGFGFMGSSAVLVYTTLDVGGFLRAVDADCPLEVLPLLPPPPPLDATAPFGLSATYLPGLSLLTRRTRSNLVFFSRLLAAEALRGADCLALVPLLPLPLPPPPSPPPSPGTRDSFQLPSV